MKKTLQQQLGLFDINELMLQLYLYQGLLFMAKTFTGKDSIDFTSSINIQSLSDDVKKIIKDLQMDLADSKHSENNIKHQLEAKNNIILNLQSNQELQKKRYNRLEQKAASLQKELQRANEQLKSHRAPSTIQLNGPSFDEVDDLRRENDLLRDTQREKSELIQNLNRQLNIIQSLLESKSSEASKLSQDLMQKNSNLSSKGLIQSVQTLDKKYIQALQEKSKFARRINELQGMLKTMTGQLNDCKKLNRDLKNKCKQLEQNVGKDRDSRANSDAHKSLSSIQKRKDIDDDQEQIVFPNSHQGMVQIIMNYFQNIEGKKQKCKFSNILGAIAENIIDEISVTTILEELKDE